MKNVKRIATLLLALVMIMSLTATAFAEEGKTSSATAFTITIQNEVDGYEYEAYQIFDGDLHENVLSNIVWGAGIDADKIATKQNELTSLLGITLEEGHTLTAEMIATKLTAENAAAFADIIANCLGTKQGTSVDAGATYTISNLDAGYYFVKNSKIPGSSDENVNDGAYTKYILEIVQNTTITPKTDVPTVSKKVEENVKYNQDGGYGTHYNDVADYNIGDVVDFKFYSKVPDMTYFSTYTFTFHDKMSAGLTFNEDSVKVTIGDTQLTSDKYSVTTGDHDGCTFHVDITLKGEGTSYTQGDKIEVSYNATLNSSAVIGAVGNPNEVKLQYSNNPNDTTSKGETPWDKVIVFTYELDVTKVDGAANENKLQGAQFVLLNAEKTKVAKVADGKFVEWVDFTTTEDGTATYPEGTTLTSGTEGLFKVAGLDDGTYHLRETKAPAGYNLLKSDIKFVIAATTANGQDWTGIPDEALTKLTIAVNDGDATDGSPNTGIVTMNVENNAGSTLPETGGMGTTLFYTIGGILMLTAVVLLVTKKRMSVDQ